MIQFKPIHQILHEVKQEKRVKLISMRISQKSFQEVYKK